jgi:sugar lactone lactonase YvrE
MSMGPGLLYTGLLGRDDEILTTTHDHYATETALAECADRTGCAIRRVSMSRDLATVTEADLVDGAPDGICLDAVGAVWYGDVPNKRCVRVREGGEVLQKIDLDRGCFACMRGGLDDKTLFIMAAEWHGPAKMTDAPRTGQVLTVAAPAPGAGWPWSSPSG